VGWRRGNGLPSIVMWSCDLTLTAGDLMVPPLTTTRPAAIQSSACRREHRPARAITLAMRVVSPFPESGGSHPRGRFGLGSPRRSLLLLRAMARFFDIRCG
jgi:hypothetical protein